jgi:antitoxin component YwqK of YwqJK toxin-antitoxin module
MAWEVAINGQQQPLGIYPSISFRKEGVCQMPCLATHKYEVSAVKGEWQFFRQNGRARMRITTKKGYYNGEYDVYYYNDSVKRVKKLTLISDSIIIDAAKVFYDFDRGNDWIW